MRTAHGSDRGRRGAVLVEFALVALVFVVLSGAVFDYGRAFFAAQQIQKAGRVAARELALLPLPPAGIDLPEALRCRRADVAAAMPPCDLLAGAPVLPRETVFDADYLAIPCARVPDGGCRSDAALDAFFADLPVVNQLLRPLMVLDRTDACSDPADPPCLLRYPGALVEDAASATGFSVIIPVTTASDGLACVPVLEAVGDAFAAPAGGLVSLRLNYPFQAAALLSWDVDEEGGATLREAVTPGPCAGLAGGTPQATVGRLPVAGATPNVGPHAGELGLGRQLAFGRAVRPFRRVISAEAAFRREVYL